MSTWHLYYYIVPHGMYGTPQIKLPTYLSILLSIYLSYYLSIYTLSALETDVISVHKMKKKGKKKICLRGGEGLEPPFIRKEVVSILYNIL